MNNDKVYTVSKSLPKTVINVILLTDECTPKTDVFLAATKNVCEVHSLSKKDFKKQYVGALWGASLYPAVRAAEEMLAAPKVKFSTAALDHIERIINMDTRGKSSEQIRQEVLRLSGELPKGHVLKDVPKSYPDRGTGIAAFTAIRKAILSLTTKESTMAKKETKAAAPGEAYVITMARAAEAKAKKAADADKTKTADKKAAKSDAGKTKASGEAKASKADEKRSKILSGAYVLNGKAATVKTPEELRLHEGSARYKLMEFMFANAGKQKNGVPVQKLVDLLGDDAAYAIQSMSKTGYEFVKQV